ncbi:MAG: hypothetical protein ACK50Q_04985 [Labrys sp. (in: a-proteobacteria)]|jgi:hypothetical protein
MGHALTLLALVGDFISTLLRALAERRLLDAGRAEAMAELAGHVRAAEAAARAARLRRRAVMRRDDAAGLRDDGFRRD